MKWLFNGRGRLIHDSKACSYCGLCARRCPHKALKVAHDKKVWKIRLLCMRCGRCVRECPKKALSFDKTIIEKT